MSNVIQMRPKVPDYRKRLELRRQVWRRGGRIGNWSLDRIVSLALHGQSKVRKSFERNSPKWHPIRKDAREMRKLLDQGLSRYLSAYDRRNQD